MWVRGLKPVDCYYVVRVVTVAPRVGAWIETRRLLLCRTGRYVAPRVGAWIETLLLAESLTLS